jgi:hypothetical protein
LNVEGCRNSVNSSQFFWIANHFIIVTYIRYLPFAVPWPAVGPCPPRRGERVPGARVSNRGDKLVPDSVVVVVVGRVLALALRRGETVLVLSRGDVGNPVVATVAEDEVRGDPTAGATTLGMGVGGGGRLNGTNGISPRVGTTVGTIVLAAGERAAGDGAAMALGGRPRRLAVVGAAGGTAAAAGAGIVGVSGTTVVAARAGRPRRRVVVTGGAGGTSAGAPADTGPASRCIRTSRVPELGRPRRRSSSWSCGRVIPAYPGSP